MFEQDIRSDEEKVLTEYKWFVDKLFKKMNSPAELVMHAAIGIAGEGGEILDAAKKHWIYNKPLDEANIREELGDILFYMQAMCNHLDIDVIYLMQTNMGKLNKRYPEGYTDKAAQERADKKGEGNG